ncbi:AAA family ATPase [Nonlabens xiamenensis]|uniref:AAA family ATPase n=1 Tax=Nonlabens xiamenensis TaxID=2341043 RepID=UPI000F60C161|nr:ATP-binding protein [Nonlabens xiamenensis]
MEKIPPQIPFDGLRIVLFGPESTGKSTLSRKLADHYQSTWVPEFARSYLQKKFDQDGHICTYEDLLPIAYGQRIAENQAAARAGLHLFCDTDALETFVYAMAYFNKAPKELKKAVQNSSYDLYLLMDIDIPWVKDDLRDKPGERQQMLQAFEQALQQFGKNYCKISGSGDQRLEQAVEAINKL